MSAIGTKRTSANALHMSAFDPKRTSSVAVARKIDTPASSQAYKLLPLIGSHEAVENLVDLVP